MHVEAVTACRLARSLSGALEEEIGQRHDDLNRAFVPLFMQGAMEKEVDVRRFVGGNALRLGLVLHLVLIFQTQDHLIDEGTGEGIRVGRGVVLEEGEHSVDAAVRGASDQFLKGLESGENVNGVASREVGAHVLAQLGTLDGHSVGVDKLRVLVERCQSGAQEHEVAGGHFLFGSPALKAA